jgi:hypothetical protein
MSWATCYSGSNNIHFNFPPIMADGRNYAAWQPDAVINERIQKEQGINTNWKYRQYLTQNALQVMKYNNSEACYDLGLPSHFTSMRDPASNVPENSGPILYSSIYDTKRPGYGYNESNLKSPYLSREQLQTKMISPTINF